mmetsp:Transcript_47813/g.126822  ORF Transcript_47813/g.126822 Transcript_47813/m.126822 type:complete len:145 (+) Transcript_47813:58-492(+)
MKMRSCQNMFMYGFAGLFLILLSVMLCITPYPQWMDQGNDSPIGVGDPINRTQEIYSGAKMRRVHGSQLHLLNGNQINAILKVGFPPSVCGFRFCSQHPNLTETISGKRKAWRFFPKRRQGIRNRIMITLVFVLSNIWIQSCTG